MFSGVLTPAPRPAGKRTNWPVGVAALRQPSEAPQDCPVLAEELDSPVRLLPLSPRCRGWRHNRPTSLKRLNIGLIDEKPRPFTGESRSVDRPQLATLDPRQDLSGVDAPPFRQVWGRYLSTTLRHFQKSDAFHSFPCTLGWLKYWRPASSVPTTIFACRRSAGLLIVPTGRNATAGQRRGCSCGSRLPMGQFIRNTVHTRRAIGQGPPVFVILRWRR